MDKWFSGPSSINRIDHSAAAHGAAVRSSDTHRRVTFNLDNNHTGIFWSGVH